MDYTVHGIFQAGILEWVAFPFSMGSSQPRDWTRVSCTAGRSFTIWVTMEAQSTPQSQMCKTSQTRSWSLFGGLLPIWSPGAFWVLAKPLHLRSMLSKPMRCIENSNACSRRDQQKGPSSSQQCPTARHTTNAPKVEQIGLWSFASSTIFIWPLTDWPPLLQASQQLSIGITLPSLAGGRKCFPRVCQILKHEFFTLQE